MTRTKVCRKRIFMSRIFLFSLLLTVVISCKTTKDKTQRIVQFIYTSDSHFGITRPAFRGDSNINAQVVNAAMIAKMNTLPTLTLPTDSGINAGKPVGWIDYLINTGDIANRQETGIQNATESWNQFIATYVHGITFKNRIGGKAEILLLPGNHDVSNAIGHYKINAPTDNASMVGIYNYMFPSTPKTNSSYRYATDKIHYSKDIAGIHFIFVNMWADSSERIWIGNDLKTVSKATPVLMFQHDEPNVESKHFTNPNGAHLINAEDKFENLLPEVFKDGKKPSDPSIIEQKGFAAFLKTHPNIKVYFHGNDNENRYYDYKGPDQDVNLKIIQVDSPMKGNISRADEKMLSFQLVTIDSQAKKMTVRECLWNSNPLHPETAIVWGASINISLQ